MAPGVILDFGFWILDFEFPSDFNPKSKIQNSKSKKGAHERVNFITIPDQG
jgi:hypothetical protein